MSPSNGKNPEWLNLLMGDSPLLSAAEIEFISNIRSQIIQKSKSSKSYQDEKLLKSKLSILNDNFKQVVDYLRESKKAQEYFLKLYPEWSIVRDASVLQLKSIAVTIETERRDYIEQKNAGQLTSLVGGAICLLFGGGFSRFLGTTLFALGQVAAVTSSEAEVSSLRKEIQKAEKIIEEDKKYSEKLWSWLSDGSYAQEALDIIRSIDVDSNWIKTAHEFQNLFKSCGQTKRQSNASQPNHTSNNIEKRIRIFVEDLGISSQVAKEVADVIGILLATGMLVEKHCRLFNTTLEKFKLYKQFTVADLASAVSGISTVVSVANCRSLTTRQKMGLGIGMAQSVISLLSSEDIDSVSKEALQIKKAADKLKEEAEVFKNLFWKCQLE